MKKTAPIDAETQQNTVDEDITNEILINFLQKSLNHEIKPEHKANPNFKFN